MLWWFLILGASTVVVVAVAAVLYVRVRRQMKGPASAPDDTADQSTRSSSSRQA
jgi:hypothetical protein